MVLWWTGGAASGGCKIVQMTIDRLQMKLIGWPCRQSISLSGLAAGLMLP